MSGFVNPFRRSSPPPLGEKAPLGIHLELWPERATGRATVTRGGKDQMVEISATYVALILNALKAMGIKL